MPEIVFLHCQTYARKPNPTGQCVTQVVGEGLRSGGYHHHVDDPKPPAVVFGDPFGFQRLHDAHVDARRTRAVKDGKLSERAIRRDRHSLFTLVASYPVPTAEVEVSPDELIRFRKWVDLTMGWVRKQYGDQLKTAFVHIDEAYPHLHCWCLPDDPSADATLLHPGKVAKRAVEAQLKSEGVPSREAVAAGNRALKKAMRDWQDSFHRAVGAPLGMRRDGPKRRRLSRAQWAAEQAMLNHHRALEEDRERLEAQVAALEGALAKMIEQQRELEAQAETFVDRAERHHRRMRDEVAQITALGPMLDAVVAELESGTIEFDAANGWRMRNPNPFRAAGKVWVKLEPAVRRLVGLMQAAEDGSWTASSNDPEYPHPRRPDPTPFEASL